MYPESISEGTGVGNYLLERMEIGGWGLFSQPVEICLGGLKCYSWNLKKKRFYSHRLNRLVNFYFFHLISRIKLLKIFPVNKKDPE